jgi:hypothetical protein
VETIFLGRMATVLIYLDDILLMWLKAIWTKVKNASQVESL